MGSDNSNSVASNQATSPSTRSDKGKAREKETSNSTTTSSSSSTTPSKIKQTSTKRSAQEMSSSSSTASQPSPNKLQKDSTNSNRTSPRTTRASASTTASTSTTNSNPSTSSPSSNKRNSKEKNSSPSRTVCVDLPEIPDEEINTNPIVGGIVEGNEGNHHENHQVLYSNPQLSSSDQQQEGNNSIDSIENENENDSSSDSFTSNINLSSQSQQQSQQQQQQLHQLHQQQQPLTLTSTVSRGSFHQCGTARRVKVYELKGETWWDRGTGYCAGVYNEQVDEALLVARMEEKCQLLDGVTMTSASSNSNPDNDNPNEGSGSDGNDQNSSVTNENGNVVHVGTGPTPNNGNGNGEERNGNGNGNGNGNENVQYVVVVSDSLDTDDVLLKSRVVREDVYQRQQDTLVVWTEPDGTDMALSFQEFEGCHEVWEFLTEVQKHFIINGDPSSNSIGGNGGENSSDSPPTTPTPQSPPPGPDLSNSSNNSLVGNDTLGLHASGFFILPDPQLGNLDVVEAMLKDQTGKSPGVRERIAESLLKEEYIKKLIPVFNDAEDLEDLNSLHLICTIMQTILMLNDNVIFEYILQDDIFPGVIGMLEYDPEFPTLKASYRDYLGDPTRFRQVVEFSDPTIVTKIHQTYRLLYLKDVILARVLDDATFSILNSFVFFHQVDIVNFCMTNENLLNQLFSIFSENEHQQQPGDLSSSSASTFSSNSIISEVEERKAEGVMFLQQLCSMGKQIQLPSRMQLYRTLNDSGLLLVIEYGLSKKDSRLRNASAELLMTMIEYDSESVRNHILDQVELKKKPLVTILSELLHNEKDLGLKTQMSEAMRVLFDVGPDGNGTNQTQNMISNRNSNSNHQQKSDPDKFLTWFYESDVEFLFSPLKDLEEFNSKDLKKLKSFSRDKSALFGHLCDLLCFFITNHSFRSQYFVLTSEISKRLGSLLNSREKHLRLSALRFFRACLSSNNQYTNRHFIKINLYSLILSTIENEHGRDNLISSACLEFFEFMKKENMKGLINHLMEKFEKRILNLKNDKKFGRIFENLYNQWEKNSNGTKGSSSALDSIGDSSNVSNSSVNEEVEEKARRMRDLERRGMNRSIMDADEENYFNDEDEEDQIKKPATSKSASSTENQNSSLVPYTEDENDGSEDIKMDESSSSNSTPSTSLNSSPSNPEVAGNLINDETSSSSSNSNSSTSTENQNKDSILEIPSSATSLISKRRREEDEEIDGLELMEKKKKLKSKEDEEEEGGFIRNNYPSSSSSNLESGNGKNKTLNKSSIAKTKDSKDVTSDNGGGGKKISLGLSSSTRKMVAEASNKSNNSNATSTQEKQEGTVKK